MFHCGFFAIGLYLLPTLIAFGRHLPNRGGIAMLNIFLGWTFFGWVAALIWAIVAAPPYFYYYPQPPYPPYPPYPPRNW